MTAFLSWMLSAELPLGWVLGAVLLTILVQRPWRALPRTASIPAARWGREEAQEPAMGPDR